MTNTTIDTQKMICMRCGAWDSCTCRVDDSRCGVNTALLTKGKVQGFNCKLQRYQWNVAHGKGC